MGNIGNKTNFKNIGIMIKSIDFKKKTSKYNN